MSLTHHGSGRFDVWAPDVSAVSLLANGQQYPMVRVASAPGADGWWAAPDAPGEADVDYGYLLDGDTHPLPDPRSRRLPDGVREGLLGLGGELEFHRCA